MEHLDQFEQRIARAGRENTTVQGSVDDILGTIADALEGFAQILRRKSREIAASVVANVATNAGNYPTDGNSDR